MSKKRSGCSYDRRKKTEKNQRQCRRLFVGLGCCCGIVLCAAAVLFLAYTKQSLTAAVVGEYRVTQAELQYYYVEAIEDYRAQAARYGGEYGLGIDFDRPLSQQSCPLTSGISWHTYFNKKALEQIQWEVAAQEQAEAVGFALSETERSAVAFCLSDMEAMAEEAGLSMNEYLLARYGQNVSAELVEKLESRRMLCACYMNARIAEEMPTQDAVEQYFQSNRRWNMLAAYWAVPLDAAAAEQEQILTTLESCCDVDAFLTCCAAYVDDSVEKRAVKHTDAAAGEMEDYAVVEWTLAEERRLGDVTVVETYDETADEESLIALYFLDSRRNDKPTRVYQEMLLTPRAVCLGETEQYWGNKRSGELLQLCGDEKMFGMLSVALSSLASGEYLGWNAADAETLGDQAYAAWVMQEDRLPGDIEMFQTEYGVYLIRFVGDGNTYWESNAKEALQSQWRREEKERLRETAPIREKPLYTFASSIVE